MPGPGAANVRKRHPLNSGAYHIPVGEMCTDVSGVRVGGGGGSVSHGIEACVLGFLY